MSDYPIPHHAAYIWLAGDTLMLGLPPRSGETKGHTVAFPNSDRGVALVLRTLRERSKLPESHITVGTRGDPTQHQLDAMLRAMATYRRKVADLGDTRHEKLDAIAEELGL